MAGSFEEVTLSDGGRMAAYVVSAASGQARVGLILLQEIFGINANMRSTADMFAGWGYDVIVPDLFWRQEPRVELNPSSATDRERATELMKGMDQPQAVEDAMAAGRHLSQASRGIDKIGAVGYCLGGKLAFLLATRPGIDAAISYYGVAIQASLDQTDKVSAPLLLHIAQEDALCPLDAQAAIHLALDGRPNVEILDHPGVGHAFARHGGSGFDQRAADRANSATRAFLGRRLDV